MSETQTDLPKIEPAKSGRSTCKGCKEKIDKDAIRIGNPYQFTTSTGDVRTGYSWFHLECTPGYVIPEVINSLKENPLEDVDQQKDTLSTLDRMFKEKPVQEPRREKFDTSPFFELAKSGRGKCRHCKEKIEKGVIRVAEPYFEKLDDGRNVPSKKYFHQDCYFDQSEDPGVTIKSIIKTSLEKQSINEDEEQEIKNEFADLFQTDSSIPELLALIGSEPIKIQFLKDKALEKGIDFKLVEKSIERGMVKGKYFKSGPDMIQELS